jgi:hypothetical protein
MVFMLQEDMCLQYKAAQRHVSHDYQHSCNDPKRRAARTLQFLAQRTTIQTHKPGLLPLYKALFSIKVIRWH